MQAFAAVTVGAVLATVGGFTAAQLGIRMDRARRGRDAALLSGEVLAGVGALLRLANEAALGGTFLDPVPARLLGFARREIDVYDRNRELLFSLADSTLRVRLHSLIVRLSIPLDRLADGRASYVKLCSIGSAPSDAAEEIRTELQVAFAYLMEGRSQIPALLTSLQPLARTKFDVYGSIDADGVLPEKPALWTSGRPRRP